MNDRPSTRGVTDDSSVWAFDVAVSTRDWLRRGEVALDYRRVEVLADGYLDASLTAYAMTAGPDDAVVTDLLWRY